MKLEYYPELQKGKRAAVEIEETDLDDRSWNHCLIGYFLDGKMDFTLLNSTARKVWKDKINSVKQIDLRFLLEFKDEEDGPYFFSQRYLVLQNWHLMMLPTKDQPSKIPAWVKMLELSLEFWTAESLCKIASIIGSELADDIQVTVNGQSVVVVLHYQWLPPICSECKVFGHPQGSCNKQTNLQPSNEEYWQVVSKGSLASEEVIVGSEV
ncbi:uncharacterized protein LOC131335705 isoform X3 [Rhododendron vialii]|uniref:uncharacterized protein LOC131335705 isoform X3 n=1 Tax=Rhododendron vialii TaxID=182163 RepID=UPI00265ECB27|nr:uncharacterized protein LOC131335705 isoform X3 [Rhododendron vialii]